MSGRVATGLQALTVVAAASLLVTGLLLVARAGAPPIVAGLHEAGGGPAFARTLLRTIAPNFLLLEPGSFVDLVTDLLTRAARVSLSVSVAAALGGVLVSLDAARNELLHLLGRSSGVRQAAVRRSVDLSARYAVLLAVAGAVLVAATMVVFPTNMDEYLPYKPDACRQEQQQRSVYREACGDYPIRLGPLEYERAFHYVGGTSSVLIAPLSAIDRGPWAHLTLGAIALALTGVGLSTSLGLGARAAPIVALVFPVMFAIVRDTGPVRLSMVAIAWTPTLVRLGIADRRSWTPLSAAIPMALLWGLATEDKPFFVFLIPLAALMTVSAFSARGEIDVLGGARWRAAAIIGTASVTSVLVPLVARVPDRAWLSELLTSSSDLSRPDALISGVRLMFSWPEASHRMLRWESVTTTGDVALLLSALIVIATMVLAARGGLRRAAGAPDGPSQWLVGASVAGFAAIVASGGWAIHHYAFAVLPIASLIMWRVATRRETMRLLLVGLTATSVLGLSGVAWVEARAVSSGDIDVAMDFAVKVAEPGEVVSCASWGCYFPHAYFGEGGIPIVFTTSRDEVEALIAATEPGSSVILVCLAPQAGPAAPDDAACSALDATRSPAVTSEPLLHVGDWRVDRLRLPG